MAMFTLEDLNGTVDGVIFPDGLAQFDHLMQVDGMVFLRGIVDFRREEPSLKVNEVYDMSHAAEELTHAVFVHLDRELTNEKLLRNFQSLCEHHRGKCPVYVEIAARGHMNVVIQIEKTVRPDTDFCRQLDALIGPENRKLLRPHDRIQKATA